MNRRTALRALLCSLAPLAGIEHARAAGRRRGRTWRTKEKRSAAASISSDRAAAIAREATGGRVLSVRLTGNGRPWYRVKVLTRSGRVRTVGVDARSGALRR